MNSSIEIWQLGSTITMSSAIWMVMLVVSPLIGTQMINGARDSSALKCVGKPRGYKVLNDTNCNCFVDCEVTYVIPRHCPARHVFDEQSQSCVAGDCLVNIAPDHPCFCRTPSTDCGCNSTTPACPTETIPPSYPTDPETPTTNPPPSTPEPGPSSDCGEHKHGDRFPHAAECRFFWECVEGRAVLRFCEIGTWWDRERLVCDFEANVTNCRPQWAIAE